MNSRKPLILVVAALLAAVAVFVLYTYVNGLKDKAYKNASKVKVWVVHSSSPIIRGTYGQDTAGTIVQSEIPRQFYPSNAITTRDQITNKVASSDLSNNQIIVDGNFVDPATQSFSLSSQLKQLRKKDQVAVTINVPPTQAVAGLIVPGDYVNIAATKVADVSAGGDAGGAAAGASCGTGVLPPGVSPDDVLFCRQARYVYQKVEVLAVGSNAIPQPGASGSSTQAGVTTPTTAPTNTNLITLIVPVVAAQYIMSLPPENIYLTLVAKDYHPTVTKSIKPFDPLPSEDPTRITPYGPQGPA